MVRVRERCPPPGGHASGSQASQSPRRQSTALQSLWHRRVSTSAPEHRSSSPQALEFRMLRFLSQSCAHEGSDQSLHAENRQSSDSQASWQFTNGHLTISIWFPLHGLAGLAAKNTRSPRLILCRDS